MKADFLDGTLRVNTALFHNQYKDLQRIAFSTAGGDNGALAQNIQNAAEATINGVEIETIWAATDNFVLTAAVGYLDASYDDFSGLDLDNDGTPDPDIAEGLDLERAPEWTCAFSANYDHEMDDMGLLSLRASYSYTDERTFNTANTRFHDSYALVDAGLTWTSASYRYKVSIFGKNLTDEEYGHAGADILSRGTYYEYLQAPRTYGVDISYNY